MHVRAVVKIKIEKLFICYIHMVGNFTDEWTKYVGGIYETTWKSIMISLCFIESNWGWVTISSDRNIVQDVGGPNMSLLMSPEWGKGFFSSKIIEVLQNALVTTLLGQQNKVWLYYMISFCFLYWLVLYAETAEVSSSI